MTLEKQFNDWITRLDKTEKVNKIIIAFNFGLIETTEGFSINLIGSKTFALILVEG
jgi:hypothetical protein